MTGTRAALAGGAVLALVLTVQGCSSGGAGRQVPPAATSTSGSAPASSSTPTLSSISNAPENPQPEATPPKYETSADFAAALAAVGVACSQSETFPSGGFKAPDAVACTSGGVRYIRLYYGASVTPEVDINEDIANFGDALPSGTPFAVLHGPNWSLIAANKLGVVLLSRVRLPASYSESVGRGVVDPTAP